MLQEFDQQDMSPNYDLDMREFLFAYDFQYKVFTYQKFQESRAQIE